MGMKLTDEQRRVVAKVIRRYRRFNGYDYTRGAALFITIVTNPRRRLFGEIFGARLQRTALGLRYNQPEFLAIREPIAAWRLSPEEFWRGIGAVDLLDGDTPFVALRISRRLSPRQIAEAVARIRRRVCDYVFVGGWISPGEKAVRDMLLAEPRGRIVQILPSAMPHDYRVGSMWLEAVRDRRAAIIARGNSEVEFSRAACLEVNDVAVELAAQALPSGQGQALPSGRGLAAPCGKAVYWLPEGPRLVS